MAGHNQSAPPPLSVNIEELNKSPFPDSMKPEGMLTEREEIRHFSIEETPRLPNPDDTFPWWEYPNITNEMKRYVTATLIGSMSRSLCTSPTQHRKVLDEPSNLEEVNFNLSEGYKSQRIPKDHREELNLRMLGLLKKEGIRHSDFFTHRGLLAYVAAAPYDAGGKYDDGLMLCVQKFGKTFYMCEFQTEAAKKVEQDRTKDEEEEYKTNSYQGLKFESYVTKTNEGSKPKEPMNFKNKFDSIVEAKLKSHTLIYGGEVDCYSSDASKYMELKTRMEGSNEDSFRKFKMRKWWLQSFLIGIEDILCGFRDKDGIVRRCKWYTLTDLLKLANEAKDPWKPNVCFNFLHKFLDYVTCNVKEQFVPHIIERKPHEKEFHLRQDTSSDFVFVPAWFAEKAMGEREAERGGAVAAATEGGERGEKRRGSGERWRRRSGSKKEDEREQGREERGRRERRRGRDGESGE